MKIAAHQKIPILVSSSICQLVSNIFLGKLSINGVIFFPILIIRDEALLNDGRFIQHEMIHYYQLIETGVIGGIVISSFEYIYALLVLRKSRVDSYFYMASEQEAHRNDNEGGYIQHRKWFSSFAYLSIKNKREIKIIDGKRSISN
ncbi:hypothetical protein BH11PAT3_BH11PAT3_0360 [soil metagenome]